MNDSLRQKAPGDCQNLVRPVGLPVLLVGRAVKAIDPDVQRGLAEILRGERSGNLRENLRSVEGNDVDEIELRFAHLQNSFVPSRTPCHLPVYTPPMNCSRERHIAKVSSRGAFASSPVHADEPTVRSGEAHEGSSS
jgi:hypothetical protein